MNLPSGPSQAPKRARRRGYALSLAIVGLLTAAVSNLDRARELWLVVFPKPAETGPPPPATDFFHSDGSIVPIGWPRRNYESHRVAGAGYKHHRPPKSLRNDLNNRPGKVAAFCGTPWNC